MTADTLVSTFLADVEMEQTQAYLTRGRAYAELPNAALRKQWAKAYEAFFVAEEASAQTELHDTDAEIRLRGLKPPVHLIRSALKVVNSRIKAARTSENDKRLVDEIVDRFAAANQEQKH